MTNDSLIEKLEHEASFMSNAGKFACERFIHVIRQHQAEQQQDVAEAVAVALSQWRNDVDHGKPQWDDLHWAIRVGYKDQAKAAIAALPKRESGSWQPIETAPKDGTDILVYTGVSCDVARWVGWGEDSNWFNGDVTFDATHWMRLPPTIEIEVQPSRPEREVK